MRRTPLQFNSITGVGLAAELGTYELTPSVSELLWRWRTQQTNANREGGRRGTSQLARLGGSVSAVPKPVGLRRTMNTETWWTAQAPTSPKGRCVVFLSWYSARMVDQPKSATLCFGGVRGGVRKVKTHFSSITQLGSQPWVSLGPGETGLTHCPLPRLGSFNIISAWSDDQSTVDVFSVQIEWEAEQTAPVRFGLACQQHDRTAATVGTPRGATTASSAVSPHPRSLTGVESG